MYISRNAKMTPARAVKILKEYGTDISEEQAAHVIEFLSELAKITVAQYLRAEELPNIGEHINKSKAA